MRVAFIATDDEVLAVLSAGFSALPASAGPLVLLEEAGARSLREFDGEAVVLLDLPGALVSPPETSAEGGAPRTFGVPRSAADDLPILAYRARGTPRGGLAVRRIRRRDGPGSRGSSRSRAWWPCSARE